MLYPLSYGGVVARDSTADVPGPAPAAMSIPTHIPLEAAGSDANNYRVLR